MAFPPDIDISEPSRSVGPGRSAWGRVKAGLDVFSTLTLIAVAGLVGYRALFPPKPTTSEIALKLPKQPITLARGEALHGDTAARAVMIEYSDFQCPYCARFAQITLPELVERFVKPGTLRVAFRHLPLTIHAQAAPAAAAAACAVETGHFWAVHDAFFKAPSKLSDETIKEMTMGAGVPAAGYDDCVARGAATVASHVTSAKDFGITATPAFLFGRTNADETVTITSGFTGARPVADFVTAIEGTAK